MIPDVSVVPTARALHRRRLPVLRSRQVFLSLLLCSAMGSGLLRATGMDVPVPEWREGPGQAPSF